MVKSQKVQAKVEKKERMGQKWGMHNGLPTNRKETVGGIVNSEAGRQS